MMTRYIDELVAALERIPFTAPVLYWYNPLVYARRTYLAYCRKYLTQDRRVVLLGMNPGPWGMVQTGVPFGDVEMVRHWLGIEGPVGKPDREHPKRPVHGFGCHRREVSGRRLWGWAKQRFKTPERFFSDFWVANYCPLSFMENNGRNITPDKLPRTQKTAVLSACDQALRQLIAWIGPEYVIGVGAFAAQRAKRALARMPLRVGRITHPSPANPRANKGWQTIVERELRDQGVL